MTCTSTGTSPFSFVHTSDGIQTPEFALLQYQHHINVYSHSAKHQNYNNQSIMSRLINVCRSKLFRRPHLSFVSTSPLVTFYQNGHSDSAYERDWWPFTAILGCSMLFLGANGATTDASNLRTSFCDSNATQSSSELTPSSVAKIDLDAVVASHSMDNLPIYTAEHVSNNDGTDGKPIWMSYGGIVYDVTNFINNHPGGSDKILQGK